MDDALNSQLYWDKRFATDWESFEGPNQSREFSTLAISQFPQWLMNVMRRDELTLVDWGCAQGDGTDVWKSYLPNNQIYGVDFSSKAIELAEKRYPLIQFECINWLETDEDPSKVYDIVFSSNTLEHFSKPYDVLPALAARAKKAVLLLLPFKELHRIDEHEFTFLAQNIPIQLPGGFTLVWAKVSGPVTVWAGEQIALVYAKEQWIREQKITLHDISIQSSKDKYVENALEAGIGENLGFEEKVLEGRGPNESLQSTMLQQGCLIGEHRRIVEEQIESIAIQKTFIEGHSLLVKESLDKIQLLQSYIQNCKEASNAHKEKLENCEINLERSTRKIEEGQRLLEQHHSINEDLRREINVRDKNLFLLSNELQNFRSSASWRITYPLRVAYSVLSKVGTPLFVRLPEGMRSGVLKKINPHFHSSGPISAEAQSSALAPSFSNELTINNSCADDKLPPAILNDDLVIIAGVPFDDVGGGQRSAQLARCALKTGRNVIYIHIYKKYDFEVNSHVESNVSVRGMRHFHVDEITPEALLRGVSSRATLLIELPHPAALPYLRIWNIRGMRSVFELIDDWETSLGGDWFQVENYHEFVRKSEVVVGTAKILVRKLNDLGRHDALYLPNAANEYIFDKYKTYARPHDLPEAAGVGIYFGSLYGEWFAWEFVEEAARRNPDFQFVLIGDCSTRKNLPSNISLLGPKRIDELPAYLSHADFALLPFAPGKISDAVSPIKVFEYLFAGKPVVSTNLPEVKDYPGVVIENTPGDFATACARVVRMKGEDIKHQNDAFISKNSWFSRLDVISARAKDTKYERAVSVIILMHNNRNVIERALASLIHHCAAYIHEIIVVDNSSTDDGAEFVEEKFFDVKIIKNSINGCASGRNLGIDASSGKFIAFFDSDQWFTSSSGFEEALTILDRDASAGAIGWAAGWFDAARDDLGGMITDYCPNRGMNDEAVRKGYRSDIAYLGTGGFFVRAEVIKSTDGFDTAYDPTCFEDTDMSLQIKRLGLDICYRDLTGIRHEPHQTTKASSGSNSYAELFKRNSDYFREKWKHRSDFFIDYSE